MINAIWNTILLLHDNFKIIFYANKTQNHCKTCSGFLDTFIKFMTNSIYIILNSIADLNTRIQSNNQEVHNNEKNKIRL